MGLKKIYKYLTENNKEINRIFEERKKNNRTDFENNKVKYWLWLLILNFEYNVLMKNTTTKKETPQFENLSYKLPSLLLANKNGTKNLEIVSCAFRKHEPNKGLTGGPNGVLATQREVFGDIYHGIRMRYIFHSKNVQYPVHLEQALSGLSFMVKINFYAAYYLEYCINSWSRLNDKTDFLFVCHDLGFAYGAYLRGCKYILVWHTQGSMINERESFGEELSERDKELLNALEKTVFENAEVVCFPSVGAKESYMSTTQIDTSNIKFANAPLYNTIAEKPKLDNEKLLAKLHLEKVNREETDIFLSVGDFSENKGLDRIPNILNQYVKETGKNVYWIAIGSKHKAGIYEKLCEEKNQWLFKCSLYGERVDHDTLLALMDYTDYYFMMQRHSIFDLSTLEAMRAGKALILSAVGGNLEVNREDNVILITDNNIDEAISKIKERDKYELGKLNEYVFNNYFSKKCFFEVYAELFDNIAMKKFGIEFNRESTINKQELSKWKNKYMGKRAVICGSGSSLDGYEPEKESINISLNRALFYDKVKFDFAFMQDAPKNQPYTIEDYNQYPCTKFYGIINNQATANMGLNKEDYTEGVNGEIVNYELAPMWYDFRVDDISFNIDEECVIDAKSVVFSAIQFAVFAGFTEILLYGVDFSDKNFSGNKNPNKYADSVEDNLVAFKKAIKHKYPNIIFRFGNTSNEYLKEKFEEIEQNE